MENQVAKELKIREDLNEMVKDIKFKHIETKYGVRNVVNVILFNGEIIEFKDSEGVYEVFQSYIKCGEKDFIKSKKLVEEFKKDEEGNVDGTYICVLYELTDETKYRLFVSKFTSVKILNNYYNLFKKNQKTNK